MATPRLPIPGSDDGTWGDILNTFLAVAHNADGSIKGGSITVTKADVGLGNVDNTSDLAKPISTATQTALNAKAATSSLATVATSGSYTDLLNKPTIPATAADVGAVATTGLDAATATLVGSIGSATTAALMLAYGTVINAKTYGAVGDGSTDDTTALNNALAAAKTAKLPLYIPPGNFKVTATLDWTGNGIVVIGAGSYVSQIRQFTSNVPIIQMGNGEKCSISGLRLIYNTKQTSANTAAVGMVLGSSSGSLTRSYFRDIAINRCGYGIRYGEGYNNAWTSGAFSCQFDTINVTGYAITALDLSCPNVNMTGNCFNNTYLNNDWEGDGNDSSAQPCVVISSNDDIVFNQLNVEHASFSAQDAIQITNGPSNVTINSLHMEVLDFNAEGKGAVYVSTAAHLTLNGVTDEGNNWSSGTSKPFFRLNADAKLVVNGMTSGYSGYTVAVTSHPLVTFTGTATDCDVWIRGAGLSEFTSPYYNPTTGCRVWELNNPLKPVNAQVGTTYTLTLKDAGCSVQMNNASANTLTVPLNSSVKFQIGTEIAVYQYGAGQTTIAPTAGVTLRSASGALKVSGQYSSAILRKIATDEWAVTGSLSP